MAPREARSHLQDPAEGAARQQSLRRLLCGPGFEPQRLGEERQLPNLSPACESPVVEGFKPRISFLLQVPDDGAPHTLGLGLMQKCFDKDKRLYEYVFLRVQTLTQFIFITGKGAK